MKDIELSCVLMVQEGGKDDRKAASLGKSVPPMHCVGYLRRGNTFIN